MRWRASSIAMLTLALFALGTQFHFDHRLWMIFDPRPVNGRGRAGRSFEFVDHAGSDLRGVPSLSYVARVLDGRFRPEAVILSRAPSATGPRVKRSF
ncbi:protein of unknown function (plasmid) [Pararobbsia alpina]